MACVLPSGRIFDVNQIDSCLAYETLPRRRQSAVIALGNQLEPVLFGVVKVNAFARDGVDFDGVNAHRCGIDVLLSVGAINAVSRPEDFRQLRGL